MAIWEYRSKIDRFVKGWLWIIPPIFTWKSTEDGWLTAAIAVLSMQLSLIFFDIFEIKGRLEFFEKQTEEEFLDTRIKIEDHRHH